MAQHYGTHSVEEIQQTDGSSIVLTEIRRPWSGYRAGWYWDAIDPIGEQPNCTEVDFVLDEIFSGFGPYEDRASALLAAFAALEV